VTFKPSAPTVRASIGRAALATNARYTGMLARLRPPRGGRACSSPNLLGFRVAIVRTGGSNDSREKST
jgi:hypothetical protein